MNEQNKPKVSYLDKCFNKKTLIQKAIIASIAIVIVVALSLSFYLWLKDKENIPFGKNGFIYIEISWNSGMGWSALDDNPAAVYSIQSVMFILMLALYLFLCNDRITASFIALAMFGGLFNLIQRACNDCYVLDYFHFGFWEGFPIFNWPDTCVVIGIFGFVISFVTITIIQAVNESRREKTEARKKAEEKAKQDSSHEIR